MAYMSGDAGTYVAKGNRTSEFYRYRDWRLDTATLATIPAGTSGRLPYTGAHGTGDGQRFVYMVKGNRTREFWRYDIVGNAWRALPDIPGRPVRAGADAVYVERNGQGYVYLLKGDKCEFWRYDVAAAAWESLSCAPSGSYGRWTAGSWLVFDGDSTIYAHKAKYHEFHSFSVAGDTWNGKSLAPMPLLGFCGKKKSRLGGCAAWHGPRLYALKGGNTQELWSYVPSGDSWFQLESIPALGSTGKPKKVRGGADMVSYENGNVPVVLHILKGGRTNEIWMYESSTPGDGSCSCEGSIQTRPTNAVEHALCRVTPSPVSGRHFQVSMTPTSPSQVRLSIYDALGRCRVSKFVNGGKTAGLDAEQLGLSPGIYIVHLDAPGYSATAKFTTTR